MKLARIPQILSLLKHKGFINDAQQQVIFADLDTPEAKHQRLFSGEAGIPRGFYTKEDLDSCLKDQAAQKAEAAVQDIQTIAQYGSQEAPSWLQANWGNCGVNACFVSPTIIDSVSAAAHVAQNIVMISNQHPDIATDMKQAVSAAAHLVRGMISGPSATSPIGKKASEWIDTLKEGLKSAVEKTDYKPQDRQGNHVPLDDFIQQRFTDIAGGIDIALRDIQPEVAIKESVFSAR